METVHTPEIWIPIVSFILFIYILMVINKKRIDKIEEQQEEIYSDAILNQLIESGQNTFM